MTLGSLGFASVWTFARSLSFPSRFHANSFRITAAPPNTAPAAPAASSSKSSKAKRSRRVADGDNNEDLVAISRELLAEVRTGGHTSTSATSTVPSEVAATTVAQALSAQADLLKEQLRSLPDECAGVRNMLSANLMEVLRKLCNVTGGIPPSSLQIY